MNIYLLGSLSNSSESATKQDQGDSIPASLEFWALPEGQTCRKQHVSVWLRVEGLHQGQEPLRARDGSGGQIVHRQYIGKSRKIKGL